MNDLCSVSHCLQKLMFDCRMSVLHCSSYPQAAPPTSPSPKSGDKHRRFAEKRPIISLLGIFYHLPITVWIGGISPRSNIHCMPFQFKCNTTAILHPAVSGKIPLNGIISTQQQKFGLKLYFAIERRNDLVFDRVANIPLLGDKEEEE